MCVLRPANKVSHPAENMKDFIDIKAKCHLNTETYQKAVSGGGNLTHGQRQGRHPQPSNALLLYALGTKQ
jgi:hypothetical protein